MQEIIDVHKNATGSEKLFYDKMQKFVDDNIKFHNLAKTQDIKNLKNKNFDLGKHIFPSQKDKTLINEVLPVLKKELEPSVYVDASFNRYLPTCTAYEVVNLDESTCTIFEHSKTWYCKIESKSQINPHYATFEIKDSALNISIFSGICDNVAQYNDNICRQLFKSVLEVKEFYEKESNISLNLNFAKYQLFNDNKEYNNIKSTLLNQIIKAENITKEVEFARFKSLLKDYLFFEKIDTINFVEYLCKSELLQNKEKQVIKEMDFSDETIQKAFKTYVFTCFSYKNIDDFTLSSFEDVFNSKYLSKQIDDILRNNQEKSLDDKIKSYITANNLVNFATYNRQQEVR